MLEIFILLTMYYFCTCPYIVYTLIFNTNNYYEKSLFLELINYVVIVLNLKFLILLIQVQLYTLLLQNFSSSGVEFLKLDSFALIFASILYPSQQKTIIHFSFWRHGCY